MKPQIIQLIDIGREKYTGVIKAVNDADIVRQARQHLLSSNVELHWQNESTGIITVGFGRVVGGVVRVGGTA